MRYGSSLLIFPSPCYPQYITFSRLFVVQTKIFQCQVSTRKNRMANHWGNMGIYDGWQMWKPREIHRRKNEKILSRCVPNILYWGNFSRVLWYLREQVLVLKRKHVTTWWPGSVKKVLNFHEAIENSSQDDPNIFLSFLPEFLKPEALQHYVPIMDSMAREHLEADWSPHKQVKVFPLSKKYTFALGCRLFLSIKDPNQVARLANPFSLITAGLASVPINFPGTTFNVLSKEEKPFLMSF